jgi:RND family efflux transporter MFP subunit
MTARRTRVALYGGGVAAVLVAGTVVWLLHHRRGVADDRERAARTREQALGPRVPVVAARRAPATRAIALPGDVRPWQQATVYARTSGYLIDLRVDRGDHVRRGDVLGVVTTPETDRQLGPLVANLSSREAIARRLRPLVPAGVATQQDLDRAEADVTAARADVDRLRALHSENEIRAPFDGAITRRYVDLGALMPAPTASTQSAQPLVDVVDTRRVRVVVYVGQRDAAAAQVGAPVEIARDDDPQHSIVARVSRISRELDLRTRTMWVEADLDNAHGALYPGVFVSVTLHVPAPPGVSIPADAIALVAGKPTVAVIRDEHVEITPVEVGDDDGTTARITQGLTEGEWIASRLSDELANGRAVRPVVMLLSGEAQARGGGR